KLVVLSEAKSKSPKTAELVKQVESLGWSSALIIGGAELDENFSKAARNIKNIDVLPQQGANVYDILRRDTLVLTRDAVENLVERLK
ncbi:MAG: 50S ribosomal protein L4, partial [Rhodospirillales bacterium]|nr:50S ribosomal protein L4 [Rhodospirillales bacterium]